MTVEEIGACHGDVAGLFLSNLGCKHVIIISLMTNRMSQVLIPEIRLSAHGTDTSGPYMQPTYIAKVPLVHAGA